MHAIKYHVLSSMPFKPDNVQQDMHVDNVIYCVLVEISLNMCILFLHVYSVVQNRFTYMAVCL